MKIKRTGILLFAIMLLLTGCGRGSTAANDESFVGQIGEMDLQDAGLGEEEAAPETVNAADDETETEMAAEAVTDETAEEDAAAGMAEPGTAYKEVEVSCNAICFYNDEAFMTGSWDTLQVIKTREGYFQVDYSVLEPGYYRMDHKIFQVVE